MVDRAPRMMSDKEKIVKSGYDRIASDYQADRHIFDHREQLREFVRLLPRGARVLDVGCGAGIPVSRFFVESGFEVVGVDFSESMLELAGKNVPEAEFIKGSMTSLGFRENSFDGLTAFYSIIHVPRERHSSLFGDLHRILRPRGALLVCLGPDEWEAVEEYYRTKMFWSHYGSEESLHLVKDAGFRVIFDEYITSGGETHYWILAQNREGKRIGRRSSD